jgi:hypothetical protein
MRANAGRVASKIVVGAAALKHQQRANGQTRNMRANAGIVVGAAALKHQQRANEGFSDKYRISSG